MQSHSSWIWRWLEDQQCNYRFLHMQVPTSSPSSGEDVAVYLSDINQPSLPTPFQSVLASVSVLMAHSTVFHSINSLDNFPLSHPVLPVLLLPYWSFQLYISYEGLPQPWYNPLWLTGLKAPTNQLINFTCKCLTWMGFKLTAHFSREGYRYSRVRMATGRI